MKQKYFSVREYEEIVNIEDVCSALSNQTRRRLLSMVITQGPMSSKRAHELYQQEFEAYRRASIYKSLEKLVSADLLEKNYEENEGILYAARVMELQLDIKNMVIKTDE